MNRWRTAGGALSVMMLAVLAAGAFWVGTILGVGPDVACAQGTPSVNHRAATLNGRTVGEVLVSRPDRDSHAHQCGRYEPQERAQIIADGSAMGFRAVLSL